MSEYIIAESEMSYFMLYALWMSTFFFVSGFAWLLFSPSLRMFFTTAIFAIIPLLMLFNCRKVVVRTDGFELRYYVNKGRNEFFPFESIDKNYYKMEEFRNSDMERTADVIYLSTGTAVWKYSDSHLHRNFDEMELALVSLGMKESEDNTEYLRLQHCDYYD